MNDLTNLALKDRLCDATDRIPTSRWPFFSTTLKGQIAIGDTSIPLTFEAERDTLLTDLSILVGGAVDDLVREASVDIEYCNVAYAENTDVAEWAYCCARKPIFLVGVRENKRLKFVITLEAAQLEAVNVEVTISGFQGDGCCS